MWFIGLAFIIINQFYIAEKQQALILKSTYNIISLSSNGNLFKKHYTQIGFILTHFFNNKYKINIIYIID